jgi:hypothetical protein
MNENLYLQLGQVFKQSFLDGLNDFKIAFKTFRSWLVGSCGALYSTRDKLFADINKTFSEYLVDKPILKGAIVIIVFLFILLLYYQAKQFFIHSWRKYILIKRESVYGNAIILLSKGYSQIHNNRGKKLEPEEVKLILTDFCDKIREIYEFKTKSKCAVSIKTIVDLKIENNGIHFDTRVLNLVRDNKCTKRYSREYDDIEHNIANNTCYQRIISKFFSNKFDDMYYLSNDILADKDYENSSFQLFPEYTPEIRENENTRREKFPLKYRSELVVSITPLIKENKANFPILGFLCVDCELEKQEVFDSKYEVPMLQGVSDGLYDFIKYNLYN